VRKGERGTTVVYADRFVPGDERRREHNAGDAPAPSRSSSGSRYSTSSSAKVCPRMSLPRHLRSTPASSSRRWTS
jgi:hypothetical protein